MAIEESKIIDLIASYEKYEEECLNTGGAVNSSRARLYRTMIKDLESLLPRKTLADLDVSDYGELTGTIVEYGGMQGVILDEVWPEVTLFLLSSRTLISSKPDDIYPLDEDRIWDETGTIL